MITRVTYSARREDWTSIMFTKSKKMKRTLVLHIHNKVFPPDEGPAETCSHNPPNGLTRHNIHVHRDQNENHVRSEHGLRTVMELAEVWTDCYILQNYTRLGGKKTTKRVMWTSMWVAATSELFAFNDVEREKKSVIVSSLKKKRVKNVCKNPYDWIK